MNKFMYTPKGRLFRLFAILMILIMLIPPSPASAVTYATVSGTLVSADLELLTGMSFKVTLTGGGNTYFTYSTASGTYSISNVVTGVIYTIAVTELEGYTGFRNSADGTTNVTVSGATTLTLQSWFNNAYTYSGFIYKPDGVTPLAGATITAVNSTYPSATNRVTTSAADGSYSLTLLAMNSTYSISASKSGYVTSTVSDTATMDKAGWNYTLTANSYTISGTVTCPNSTCPTGADVISIAYTSDGSVNVAADGTFSNAGFPPGTYTLTPSFTVANVFTFSPTSQTVTVEGSNVSTTFTATYKTYKISGYVKTPNNTPIEGASVTITNTALTQDWTTTTNSGGYYEQTSLPADYAGSYVVSVEKSPLNFTTTSPTAPFTLLANTVKTFTSDESAYSISGTITAGGVGVQGVTVTAVSATSTTTATTDSSGHYTLAGLLADSSTGTDYTVTPSGSGMTFTPTSTTINLKTGNATADFTTSTFSISGTITDDGSTGKGGLTVSAGTKSATTASDGTYTITGLIGGDYTVIPSPSGYFSPTSQYVTVNSTLGDAVDKDFTYLYSISGNVSAGGVGVEGVLLSAYTNPATSTYTATSDSNGNYTITGMPINNYYVSATKSGYTFAVITSNEANFSTTHANVTGLSFNATVTPIPGTSTPTMTRTSAPGYMIAGWVEDADGNPAVGATVSTGFYSATSNDVGFYTIYNVPPGTYTVKCILTNYTFASKTVTITINHVYNFNFAGSRYYGISGTITISTGSVLSGATVRNTTNSTSTSTDGSGNYSFTKLATGSYTISPLMEGYSFSPASRVVSVGPDATGRNFTAYVQQVDNGSFESGSSNWETPATPSTAGTTTTQSYSGSTSMRVGITNQSSNKYSYSSSIQTIQVPSNSSAVLGFWLYPISYTPASNDLQYVLVLNRYGQIVEWLMRMRRNDQSWLYYQFDLSEYAGQTIKVLFGVYNDGYGGSTGMYVDDVTMRFTSYARSGRNIAPMVSVRKNVSPGERIGLGAPGRGTNLAFDQVRNGNFETAYDWDLAGTAVKAMPSNQFAHTGSGSLLVGITNPADNKGGTSFATQILTVSETHPTLGVWLYPFSNEKDGKDVQSILVLDRNDRVIDTLLWTRRGDQKWIYYEFDLSQYAGQTIKLYFGAYNDGQGGVTGMFVDDVKVR